MPKRTGRTGGEWIRAVMSVPRGNLQRRTGIPAPVLRRLDAGLPVKLSRRMMLALYNVYRSENYRALKAAGIDSKTAMKIARSVDLPIVEAARSAAIDAGPRGLRNLNRLIDAGMKPLEAAAHAARPQRDIESTVRKLDKYARLIWENAKRTRQGERVRLCDIKAGLRKSVRFPTMQEVEKYTKPYARGEWIQQPTFVERERERKRLLHEKAQEEYLKRTEGQYLLPEDGPEEYDPYDADVDE